MTPSVRTLLILLLIPLTLPAQQGPGSQIALKTENYRIENFTLPGGISANSVNCIVEGPYGFLWFASQNGIHRYDGHHFLTYNKEEGDTIAGSTSLTFPRFQQLYWDRNNKLWACSYGGGLFRFDPETEQFRNYAHDPNDPRSISNDQVICAVQDTAGYLWAGTVNGLNRLDPETGQFKRFFNDPDNPNSLSDNVVGRVYVDKQGTLWAGTGTPRWFPHRGGGLNRYNPTTDSFTRYLYDPQDTTSIWTSPVHGLLEDSRGNFWVGTTRGLQRMARQAGTFKRMHYHPNRPHAPGTRDRDDPTVWSLLEDRSGGLWVGTISSAVNPPHLLRYDPEHEAVQVFPIPGQTWSICETRDRTVWVSDELAAQVVKIVPEEERYDLLKGEFLFSSFEETDLYYELKKTLPEGRLLGPYSLAFDLRAEGRSMWLKFVFAVGEKESALGFPILVNIGQQAKGAQFHHLEDLGLIPLNTSPFLGNAAPNYGAAGMAVDKEGRVWGSYPSGKVGVFCFDPRTGDVQNYVHDPQNQNGLTSNEVTYVLQDLAGKIWVAQLNAVVSRLDPASGQWTHFSIRLRQGEATNESVPAVLSENNDGKIWVGGIVQSRPFINAIDPKSNTSEHYSLPKEYFGHARFFAQKKDTVIFAIDNHGIGILHPPTSKEPLYFVNLEKDNYPLDFASSIVLDSAGKLWSADFSEGLFAFLDIEEKKWFSFRSGSGESGVSRSGVLGPDGKVYFPNGKTGWFEIDPALVQPSPEDFSQLRLTDLYINGERQIPGSRGSLTRPIWSLDKLNLSYRVKQFGLQLSNFDFHDNANSNYLYRLFPYETNWRNLSEDFQANYKNITAGTYRFQVQKSYSDPDQADYEIDLEITIHPPWWKTWWAYSLMMVIVLGTIYSYVQWRTRTLRRQQAILRERVAEQTEELRQAKNEAEAANEAKSIFLSTVSHELRTPLTSIIGFAKINKKNLEEKLLSKPEPDPGKVQRTLVRNSKNLDIITSEGQRLTALINELLDLAKIESGKVEWKMEEVDPANLIEQAITASSALFLHKQELNLIKEIPDSLPTITADRNRLIQVLINLISNAVKFSDAGNVTLGVKIYPSGEGEDFANGQMVEQKEEGYSVPDWKNHQVPPPKSPVPYDIMLCLFQKT